MLTASGATAQDVSSGQPFPPFVVYANPYDRALGDLQRVATYAGDALSCLDRAASYLTGTYTDGQIVDVSGSSPAGQQIGFAITWLRGAAQVMSGIACPCPAYFNGFRWDQAMNNFNAAMYAIQQGVAQFNLDVNTGHVTASSQHNALLSLRNGVNNMYAIASTGGCQTDDGSSGTGGGGGSGGGEITFTG